jgi:hypothetical protein
MLKRLSSGGGEDDFTCHEDTESPVVRDGFGPSRPRDGSNVTK